MRCPVEPELAQWTLQGQTLSHTMAPTMTIQVRLPLPLLLFEQLCLALMSIFRRRVCNVLIRCHQDVKVFIQSATQLPANKQVWAHSHRILVTNQLC